MILKWVPGWMDTVHYILYSKLDLRSLDMVSVVLVKVKDFKLTIDLNLK